MDGNLATLKGHLYFAPATGVKPSVDELGLVAECESIAEILRTFSSSHDDAKPRPDFAELLRLAQLGLVGEGANLFAAQTALVEFKVRLMRRIGPKVRTRYLNLLATIAVRVGGAFAIVGAVLLFLSFRISDYAAPANESTALADANQEHENPPPLRTKHDPWQEMRDYIDPRAAANYSFMLAASMAGLWMSFAMRRKFTFEQLFMPEDDLLGPWHRAVFVLVATALIAFLCSLNVAGVSVGDFSTANLGSSTRSAFVFGAIGGIGERMLGDVLMPFVASILGRLRPRDEIEVSSTR